MGVTASQIRQDLNCFGGFGQQGYGYNVRDLYDEISGILGVTRSFRAIIVGMGNMGRALAGNQIFVKRGVELCALFDNDLRVVGTRTAGLPILNIADAPEYVRLNRIDIAVLTVPREAAEQVARTLAEAGIRGIWNFSNTELHLAEHGVKVKNVHLGDTLMLLNYELASE